ncbi:ankyrin repeat domain-containing protein [Achromobacter dolens]|uniref:ankyrin repeat domain-containing protein n=1 Tax=Achromobacter dolens TaxID=1287738 RepID=UPI003B9F92BF
MDAASDDGGTPLMAAAARGNAAIAALLLAHGAEADRRDEEGWNAWAWAIEKGAQDVADLLEEAGAEPAFPEV